LGCIVKSLEERRLGDVGALAASVDLALHALDLLPQLARLVLTLRSWRGRPWAVHRVLHQRVDLVAARPDVAQVDVLARLALADRLGHQVARHVAGDRVGHHQRRAGQEVGLQVRVDARLEVAVARQHRGAHQVVLPVMASLISGVRSPALPMQVVQP
jgi:hypothetical protein